MTALKENERSDETLREEALERLKKRQDLRAHLLDFRGRRSSCSAGASAW